MRFKRNLCIGLLTVLFIFSGIYADNLTIFCVGTGMYISWILIDFLDWLQDRRDKKVKEDGK